MRKAVNFFSNAIWLLVLLCILLTACSSVGNVESETTGQIVILTLTEERVVWHGLQQPIITTQEVRNGDRITLEWAGKERWTVIIEEIRDNSVAVRFEGRESFEVREAEIEYGEEYEIGTGTLSSWTIWTLVFTRR